MNNLTSQEIQQIAKEAYIYGFPMVVNYKTMYRRNTRAGSMCSKVKPGFTRLKIRLL